MPMDKSKYPRDWNAISKAKRTAAGWRCEWCGIDQGAVATSTKGQPYKIVLTVAHIDQNTENNNPDNLAALCQPCHLRHDAGQHAANARQTRQKKKAAIQPGLFDQEV